MKNLISKIAIVVLLVVAAQSSFAQASTNKTQAFSLTLNNIIDITVSGTPTATFSSVSDYDNGVTVASGATIAVKSNKNWTIAVKASSANFTGSPSSIPCSVLQFKNQSGGSFAALATTDASVGSGNNGNNGQVIVDYKVVPGYTYEAGTYSLTVVYTATQQ